MPLEIRELVIRATVPDRVLRVDEDEEDGQVRLSEEKQAAIIAACIDQVLSILQARSER